MHDKISQRHTLPTSRSSSFFIENLLGCCRTEPSVSPVKENDGAERKSEILAGSTEAHRKEIRSQAFSPDLKTEKCRGAQSPLEWYGRETSKLNAAERPESKLISTCILVNLLVYIKS